MRHRLLTALGWLASGTCIGVAVLAGGCSSFDRPYPEKALFAIQLGAPSSGGGPGASDTRSTTGEQRPAQPVAPVLRVKSVRIAEPFDTTSFVYKVGASRFARDYYNGFVTEPDRLLSGELLNWLMASGAFGSVVGEGSMADYRLTLESIVTELYGDYTNKRSPQAVMELKVFLIDEAPSASRVIFQKTYRETRSLAGNRPEELVRGWEEAYRTILTRLVSDLRALPRAAHAGRGRLPSAPGVLRVLHTRENAYDRS